MKEKITTRSLIHLLLDYPMDWEIVIRRKSGYELENAEISIKKPEQLKITKKVEK